MAKYRCRPGKAATERVSSPCASEIEDELCRGREFHRSVVAHARRLSDTGYSANVA